MKEQNIPPLGRIYFKQMEPIILDGINDSRLPVQIAEEIQHMPNIIEVTMLPPNKKRTNPDFRITLKSSDEFNKYLFYTVDQLTKSQTNKEFNF